MIYGPASAQEVACAAMSAAKAPDCCGCACIAGHISTGTDVRRHGALRELANDRSTVAGIASTVPVACPIEGSTLCSGGHSRTIGELVNLGNTCSAQTTVTGKPQVTVFAPGFS
jgi:hypothetical protein